MFLRSLNTAAMEKALDATWQRMQTVNTNIANEDTPGYKTKRLAFEDILDNELKSVERMRSSRLNGGGLSRREAVGRIDNVRPVEYQQLDTVTRADENNVDILAEQAELTRLQYQYQALTQKVSGYYANLKFAITGR